MKKLPLGIQNFREIVEGGYVYADKTQFIYKLINGAKYYFLSRPRRFGKSLLLDTISEAFSGKKELFKGLWIYGSDYSFPRHPVVRLDMGRVSNETPEILKKSILSNLELIYSAEGFELKDTVAADAFARLIVMLNQKYGQRVVVLVDEYDKQILDHITDIETASANRQAVRGFYGILKSMDPYLRFTFISGVTKFTKTSVFSGLNNLLDITLKEEYANICGIETGDLGRCFGEHIRELSTHKNFRGYDDLSAEILKWYDGYSWDGDTRVLNPFSLLTFLMQERFSSYWYASGTPGFLPELIKNKPDSYTNIGSLEITEHMLDSADIGKLTLAPLLFQTGYLTVKEILTAIGTPVYVLEAPNLEVREAFNMNVLSAMTENDDVRTGQMRLSINRALQAGDLQRALEMLRGFFASIPYELHVDLEAYYHSIFYAFMSALGFDLDVEVSVAKGRVDAALELGDKVYVMEFKYVKCPPDASDVDKQRLFDKALDEAMAQIRDRGYGDKYQGSGKTIYEAAFAFLGRGDIEMRACVLSVN